MYNDRTEDDEWFECQTHEDEALDDEEFFESRDGFVIEQNYNGEIYNIVFNHPELTCVEARKINKFECKVNGIQGNVTLLISRS